jgi:DNA-directed RNA polymerase specialized sigma24 family protein
MSTETQPPLAMGRVLTAAVLLSGDLTQAEDAVADAILSLDTDDFETEAFLMCVLILSIQRSRNSSKRSTRKTGEISATLPAELQNVLNLSLKLRHCFVLRVLLGLPKETCSQMLQVDDDEVEKSVSSAAIELAAVREPMRSSEMISSFYKSGRVPSGCYPIPISNARNEQ